MFEYVLSQKLPHSINNIFKFPNVASRTFWIESIWLISIFVCIFFEWTALGILCVLIAWPKTVTRWLKKVPCHFALAFRCSFVRIKLNWDRFPSIYEWMRCRFWNSVEEKCRKSQHIWLTTNHLQSMKTVASNCQRLLNHWWQKLYSFERFIFQFSDQIRAQIEFCVLLSQKHRCKWFSFFAHSIKGRWMHLPSINIARACNQSVINRIIGAFAELCKCILEQYFDNNSITTNWHILLCLCRVTEGLVCASQHVNAQKCERKTRQMLFLGCRQFIDEIELSMQPIIIMNVQFNEQTYGIKRAQCMHTCMQTKWALGVSKLYSKLKIHSTNLCRHVRMK